MNWGGWSQFWHMGGYGFFVWGSYGVTALAIALEVWALLRRAKRSRAGSTR
jgi:heme exporter protein D